MISSLDFIKFMGTLSLTIAALILPTISIAYFIISNSEDDDTVSRMSSIIGTAPLTAILFVICALISFVILLCGWEDCDHAVQLCAAIFIIGFLFLIYILLILAGITRVLPALNNSTKGNPAVSSTPPAGTVTVPNISPVGTVPVPTTPSVGTVPQQSQATTHKTKSRINGRKSRTTKKE